MSHSYKTTRQVTNSTERLAGTSSQTATQRTALEAAGHLDSDSSRAHYLCSDAALQWFKSRYAGLWGLPSGSVGKEPACNVGDAEDEGSVLVRGSDPGGGHGNPLQYLAWRIPWTKEPGELPSIELHRHDWSSWARMPMQAFKTRACSFLCSWKQAEAAEEKFLFLPFPAPCVPWWSNSWRNRQELCLQPTSSVTSQSRKSLLSHGVLFYAV